ncbi:hypothetical protein MSG28_012186 [Choristoneura fumiferana]|uniref:Uncharacterized protein n=1 Tax=Choristoneura fumiferana TaxID=7141 RepID=A0ACC0KBZ4_CHOFU|nr:hypothetical protein MSG28_012186 [Choristoneura fumiferana]
MPNDQVGLLMLFRILGKRKVSVLLMHGIGDSADTFIIREHSSLAVTLASTGYDVWAASMKPMIDHILKTTGETTSRKSLIHWDQMVLSKTFCSFDYGKKGNKERYIIPPDYNVREVSAKVALLVGRNGDHL